MYENNYSRIPDTLQFPSHPGRIDQGYAYPVDATDKDARNPVVRVDDLAPCTLFCKTIYAIHGSMLEMLLITSVIIHALNAMPNNGMLRSFVGFVKNVPD